MTDLVFSQLTDVFRIGLMVALVFTMRRTAAVTGRWVPLGLGVIFVAIMLPSTMPSRGSGWTEAVLAGLLSNTVILVAVLAVGKLLSRWRG